MIHIYVYNHVEHLLTLFCKACDPAQVLVEPEDQQRAQTQDLALHKIKELLLALQEANAGMLLNTIHQISLLTFDTGTPDDKLTQKKVAQLETIKTALGEYEYILALQVF